MEPPPAAMDAGALQGEPPIPGPFVVGADDQALQGLFVILSFPAWIQAAANEYQIRCCVVCYQMATFVRDWLVEMICWAGSTSTVGMPQPTTVVTMLILHDATWKLHLPVCAHFHWKCECRHLRWQQWWWRSRRDLGQWGAPNTWGSNRHCTSCVR